MTRHHAVTAIFTSIVTAVIGVAGCSAAPARRATTGPATTPAAHARTRPVLTRQARPVTDAVVRRSITLGYSVHHRPITAIETGDPDSPRRALVVGCIHGNEPAGIAIARALTNTPVPPEVDLWVVADLNPDGVAAGTRANAHGVDLNRNFPYRWRPLGALGSSSYAGPRPLSEPESRAIAALIRRVRPTLGIWYHQALNVVDNSQGPRPLERRYAIATGMSLRRLPDYPGSAVGDEDHRFGPTAFVVELPAGQLTRAGTRRHAKAVVDIAIRS